MRESICSSEGVRSTSTVLRNWTWSWENTQPLCERSDWTEHPSSSSAASGAPGMPLPRSTSGSILRKMTPWLRAKDCRSSSTCWRSAGLDQSSRGPLGMYRTLRAAEQSARTQAALQHHGSRLDPAAGRPPDEGQGLPAVRRFDLRPFRGLKQVRIRKSGDQPVPFLGEGLRRVAWIPGPVVNPRRSPHSARDTACTGPGCRSGPWSERCA